jgi:hypothetical protein
MEPQLTPDGFENAAEDLAALASTAADILQQLAVTDARQQICSAAEIRNSWPVNIQLGVKRINGSREYGVTLKDAKKVKEFLQSIQLGRNPERPLKRLQDPEATPFTKAAELLLSRLLDWREDGACVNFTPWAKDLMSLDYPMTKDNVNDWWTVAKRWMDEQWEAKPELFTPLKKACRHEKSWKDKAGKKIIEEKEVSLDRSDTGLFDSEIKSRVIDLRLKEAFFALAKPADL